MEKPECPECKEEMLVQERYITASYVDELELGDPAMPNPGDREKEWADEDYHPHYWCPKCNKYFSFSLEPLSPLIAGQHNQDQWHNDNVQFPRFLAEVWAVLENKQMNAIIDSMDLSYDDVRGLFERAERVWEEYKNAIAPVIRVIEFDHEGTPIFVSVSDSTVDMNSIKISISKTGRLDDATPAKRKRV